MARDGKPHQAMQNKRKPKRSKPPLKPEETRSSFVDDAGVLHLFTKGSVEPGDQGAARLTQSMQSIASRLESIALPKIEMPSFEPLALSTLEFKTTDEDILRAQRETLEVMRSLFDVQRDSVTFLTDGLTKLQSSTDATGRTTRSMLWWMIGLNIAVLLASAGAAVAGWLALYD